MTLLTERDTVNPDGSLNWSAIREIAMLRAIAEHHIDIITRVYRAPLRLPAGISQDDINDWRADLAAKAIAANPALETTPFIELYRAEYRRAYQSARAIRSVKQAQRLPDNELKSALIRSVERAYVTELA